jgi:ribose transport system ATP-binding protein
MDAVLSMTDVSKSFAGVQALDGVMFGLRRGEVHALVGENGAGKSTLVKILSGAYRADTGTICVDGEVVERATPRDMLDRGIAVIYQELALAPHLSVAENVFLGRLPRTRLRAVDWRKLRADTAAVLERLGVELSPSARVGRLSVAQQQMVEIAKALSMNARVIVLDEPSAVLGDTELEQLFAMVRQLAATGVSFIYISHRLNEIFEIAQRVTVLRDGEVAGHTDVADISTDELVKLMVGRDIANVYPDRDPALGEPLLSVRQVVRAGVLHGIDLDVRRGEIVGVAGLAGSGRTELLRVIAGADPFDRGEITLAGQPLRTRSPRGAIKRGVGLLPEDRKQQGLFLARSVRQNITMSKLAPFRRAGLLRVAAERRTARHFVDKLRIRTPGVEFVVRNLSGGNQQKCVFARWLHADCDLLLVDEPTRGIDVGAKQEIYRLLTTLAADGVGIVMVSSELPEVLGLSDRILVLHEGRLAGQLDGRTATEEQIMRLATGQAGTAAA